MLSTSDLGPDAAYYIWINSFHDLSAAVLLYYDYVLTLPREIQFLWPPHNKQGWFTLAFFLNRYIPIIGVLPIVVSYFIPVNPTVRPCEGLYTYHYWFIIAVQMHSGTLCVLRVYALYGRSRRILGLFLFVGTGSIITTLVSLFLIRDAGSEQETFPVVSTFRGCARYMLHIGGRSAAIAWTGALVSDSVIFSLTLYKAFAIGRGVKLLYVIVRDGTMYFSAISLMNLGNIMTLLFAPPLLKTSITAYTNVLSIILVNRLVLNLREQAAEQLPATVETTMRFRAALPVSRQPLSMTSIRNPSFVRQNRSTATVTDTCEAVASVPAGESPSQQLRSMDVIGYETEQTSQATLSVERQQPATSASVRSLSSVRQRQNRSIGETPLPGLLQSHWNAVDATSIMSILQERTPQSRTPNSTPTTFSQISNYRTDPAYARRKNSTGSTHRPVAGSTHHSTYTSRRTQSLSLPYLERSPPNSRSSARQKLTRLTRQKSQKLNGFL